FRGASSSPMSEALTSLSEYSTYLKALAKYRQNVAGKGTHDLTLALAQNYGGSLQNRLDDPAETARTNSDARIPVLTVASRYAFRREQVSPGEGNQVLDGLHAGINRVAALCSNNKMTRIPPAEISFLKDKLLAELDADLPASVTGIGKSSQEMNSAMLKR